MLPLNEDESIDEERLREQVEFVIADGAAAICAPGLASEVCKLTDEERRRVITVVTEHTRGRLPVFAGTACGSVRATIELSRYAQSVGAAGLMISAPIGISLGARDQCNFFETICRNVDIAVMLQDADFTGAGLPVSIIVELGGRCPNLTFVKLENVLAGSKCAEIIHLSKGNIQVLYGMQGVALIDGLAHGATGVMPGPSFVRLYTRVFKLYGQGRISQAKTLFYRMQPYMRFAVQHLELVIQLEKRALLQRGVFSSDRTREPTIHLDHIYQKEMDELIELMLGLSSEAG